MLATVFGVRSRKMLVTVFDQGRRWSRCSAKADVCHDVRSGQTFVTMFGQGRCWTRCSDKADVGHGVRTRQMLATMFGQGKRGYNVSFVNTLFSSSGKF